jgi:hypothetical protein
MKWTGMYLLGFVIEPRRDSEVTVEASTRMWPPMGNKAAVSTDSTIGTVAKW